MEKISLTCQHVDHQFAKIMGVCLEEQCKKCVLLCFECTKDHKDHKYIQLDKFITMVMEQKYWEQLEKFKKAINHLIDVQIKQSKYIQQKLLQPENLNRKELIELVNQFQFNQKSSLQSVLNNQWILIKEWIDLNKSVQLIEEKTQSQIRCSMVENNQDYLNELIDYLTDYRQNIPYTLTQVQENEYGVISGACGFVNIGGPINDIKQDKIYLKVTVEKITGQLLIGLQVNQNIVYGIDDKFKLQQKMDSQLTSSTMQKSYSLSDSPTQTLQSSKISTLPPKTVITVVFNKLDKTITYNFQDETKNIVLNNIDYSIPKLGIFCCLKLAQIRIEV